MMTCKNWDKIMWKDIRILKKQKNTLKDNTIIQMKLALIIDIIVKIDFM